MTACPTIADFPVRPQPRDGESLAGYCWRIYAENCHDVPPEVRVALKAIKVDPEVCHQRILGHLLGQQVFERLRVREDALTERWHPQCKPGWFEWAQTPRLCPACISHYGYHALIWDLPLVTACAEHRSLLVESCHACGRTYTWQSLGPRWRCRCGAKVTGAPIVNAPRWAISLTRLLMAASDAQVPIAVPDSRANLLAARVAYRTRDIYEMLWWFLKMRRAFTERRSYPLPQSWPVVKRRGARMKPGAWEVRLVEGLPKTLRSKTRYTLRWVFRRETAVLVDLRGVECLRLAEKLMPELDGQLNALAGRVREAIEKILNIYCASIPMQHLIYFHPRLGLPERQRRLDDLAHWWRVFAAEVRTLDPADQLCRRSDPLGQFTRWRASDSSAVMALLNVFFEAAHRRWPSTMFRLLACRWHMPIELRKPNDVLAEVGVYLTRLHSGELAFVQALVDDAINERAVQQRRADPNG